MAPVAGICGLSEEVTLAMLPRLFYEELLTELNRRGMNMDSSTLDKGDLVSLLQDLMVEEYFTLQTLVDPPSLQNSGTPPSGVEVNKDGFGFPGTEIEPKNIVTSSVVKIKQEVEDPFPMYATCIGSERGDICTLLTAAETLEQFEGTSEVGLRATDEINVKTEKSDDEIYDHFGCTDEAFKILPQENAYQDIVDENHKKGLRRCPHCAYTTVHATTMKRHMFTHMGEKPFACSLCNYTTSRKYSLDHHMNNHANWERDSLQKDADTIGAPVPGKKMEDRKKAKQKCYFCPFTSGTKKSMTRHLAEKHARQHSLQERNHQHDTSANNSSVSNNRAFLETVDSFDHQTGLEYGSTSPVATYEMPQTSECNSVHNSTTGSDARQGVLSCPLCKYTSRLVKQMEQHVRSHTAKGPFKCPECSFLAVERSELFLHIETHIKDGRFSCQVCGYRAATCGGLTRHRMSQHLGKGDDSSSLEEGIQPGKSTGSEKTSLECQKCSYCTTNRSRFEEHVKMHHKSPGRFTCQVCGFWAVNRAGLQKHMKLHTGKGSGTAGSQEVVVPDGSPLQVELVSYRYDDQMSADKRGRDTESKDMTVPNHKVTVPNSETPFADIAASKQAVSIETEGKTEEDVETVQHKGKPYVCGECGYRVASRSTLFTHMKKHQGGKVYNCQICGLHPSSHKDFILHMRTHTGEKPFKCPQCTLSFARKQNLKRHLQVHERQ